MKIIDLPQGRRGTTWFWGLMKPGESGYDLARRVPMVPDDLDPLDVYIWTKVTSGANGVVLLAVLKDGVAKVYSFKGE